MGLITAVAPALLSGLFQAMANKREERNAAIARANDLEDAREQFTRLRAAAEKAGFNPLTALGATGGAGFTGLASGVPGAVAPLVSASVLQNAVQGVEDVVTGRAATRDAMNRAQLELMQIDIQNARAIAPSMPKLGGYGVAGNRNGVPGVTVEPGGFKFPGEADRVGLDEGGSITEENIHEIQLPLVNSMFSTRNRFRGQIVEDYMGDGIIAEVLGLPFTAAGFVEDAAMSAGGYHVNPATGKWESDPEETLGWWNKLNRASGDAIRYMVNNPLQIFNPLLGSAPLR